MLLKKPINSRAVLSVRKVLRFKPAPSQSLIPIAVLYSLLLAVQFCAFAKNIIKEKTVITNSFFISLFFILIYKCNYFINRFANSVLSPLNTLKSTFPCIPFTCPLSLCCQKCQFLFIRGSTGLK